MRGSHLSMLGLVGATTLLLAVACSGQRNSVDQQIADLSDEVTILRRANELLEVRVTELESRPRPVASASAEPSVPELEVVRLTPESEATPDEAPAPEPSPSRSKDKESDDEGGRPLIHGSGDSIETKMPAGKKEEPTSQLFSMAKENKVSG